MSVTQAQVNAGKAQILDRLFIRYPAIREPAIRIAVQLAKGGTATQLEVRQAILQEAYTSITGRAPLSFKHNFQQLLRSALEDPTGLDPTTGILPSDSFEPVAVTIT